MTDLDGVECAFGFIFLIEISEQTDIFTFLELYFHHKIRELKFLSLHSTNFGNELNFYHFLIEKLEH